MHDKNKIKLSIVVPCYNEFAEILPNYGKACELVKRYPLEIIFLNNGSTDSSQDIFKKLAINSPENIYFLKIDANKGYGFGIKYALSYCKGEFIGWTHGDGQTDLMDLGKAFELIEKYPKVGMIKGRRVGRAISEQSTSKVLELLYTAIFGFRFLEINAQPSIYKAQTINNYKEYSDDLLFDIDAYVYAGLGKAETIRFEVYFPPREHGASSWNSGIIGKMRFITNNIIHLINLKITILKRKL